MVLSRRSDKIEALKEIPLFRDLGRRHLDAIAKQADEVDVPAGKVLVRQGEQGQEFILIMRGTARVEKDGKAIAHLGSGDFFGEMSLLEGKARTATVVAEEPSKLLVIHRRSFGLLLDTVPGLARKMLSTLSARLRSREENPIS